MTFLERLRDRIARAVDGWFDVERHEGCGGELDYWGRAPHGGVKLRCLKCGACVTIKPKW